MAESTPTVEEKFTYNLGDLVWARVKGYPYWPGEVLADPTADDNYGNLGRKPKNGHLIRFFGANNVSWVAEDQLKPYLQFREKMAKAGKSGSFKTALKQSDAKISQQGVALPQLEISAVNSPSTSTPKPDKPEKPAVLFKGKKVSTNSTSTPVQRDYSRTPFKKEKRNFESTAEAGSESPQKSGDTNAADVPEPKKRAKVEIQSPRKRTMSSPTKPPPINESYRDDDHLSEGPSAPAVVEQPMEQIQIKRNVKIKPSSLKFGFIGLGTIGKQVLKHLITTGHDVTIWNRTMSKCTEFEEQGVAVANTPGDVIREADITFSCLSSGEVAQKIFFGNCGIAQEINASKGYVELTSMDPSTSEDIESSVKRFGGRYMEAPLICTMPKQIEEGKCIALVSGNRSLFDDCGSCFQAICSHVYFLSESAGNAAKLNIVVSSYYGNMLGSLLESISLVEKLGLFPKDFVEILGNSPFASAMIETKAQSMADSTLVHELPIDPIRRDLTYALHLSNRRGFSTPITATTNEMFKQKKHHFY